MLPAPAPAPSGPPAGLLAASKFDALDRLFGADVSHKSHPFDVEFSAQIDEAEQGVDAAAPLSTRPRQADLSPYTVGVERADGAERAPVATSSTRSRKAKAPPLDGRRRRQEGPLDRDQLRELGDARAFAADLGRPLLCAVDVNPWRLDQPPEGDVGQWLRDGPLRIAAQFMGRQKDKAGRPIGWHAVTIRENYASEDGRSREHGHVICSCPRCLRPKLAKVLTAAFPGERAILVHEDEDLDEAGWAYRTKQRMGNTAGPPGPRRQAPERHSREDGAPVAPVLGKRISVSRSLGRPERVRAGWQADRDEARAVAKVERAFRRARDRGDAGLSPMG